MYDLDFDFTAEHPKADMSKVDVIRVNGKEYLAADNVLEIIKKERKRYSPHQPSGAWACDNIRQDVTEKWLTATQQTGALHEIYKKGYYETLQQRGHCRDCKWWKDSDGVYRRGVSAESKCPINRTEVLEGNGYCYMFEPQESDDCISRQAVLSYIYNDLGLGDEENGADVERQIALEEFYEYIKSLPPVTVLALKGGGSE